MRLILLFALSMICLPVYAGEWLIYASDNDGESPIMICDTDTEPAPPAIPPGSLVVPFVKDTKDKQGRIERYFLNSKAPEFKERKPRTAPPPLDLNGFRAAISSDKGISAEEAAIAIRSSYITDDEKRKEFWSEESAKLSDESRQAIESYATQYRAGVK